MVLAWSVFEEMPSPPLFPPPTSKANMFCCGFFFFQHPFKHKLSGTTGSFSLSFVSPETDLFKWYAGSTLLLQALVLVIFQASVQLPWKLWKMGLSRRTTVPPEAEFFLHFSKEIPLPDLLRRAALGRTWFLPRDWKARKLLEWSSPSWGDRSVTWLGVPAAAPTRGTTAPTPSFRSGKGGYRVLYRSFISLSPSSIPMASFAACHV